MRKCWPTKIIRVIASQTPVRHQSATIKARVRHESVPSIRSNFTFIYEKFILFMTRSEWSIFWTNFPLFVWDLTINLSKCLNKRKEWHKYIFESHVFWYRRAESRLAGTPSDQMTQLIPVESMGQHIPHIQLRATQPVEEHIEVRSAQFEIHQLGPIHPSECESSRVSVSYTKVSLIYWLKNDFKVLLLNLLSIIYS